MKDTTIDLKIIIKKSILSKKDDTTIHSLDNLLTSLNSNITVLEFIKEELDKYETTDKSFYKRNEIFISNMLKKHYLNVWSQETIPLEHYGIVLDYFTKYEKTEQYKLNNKIASDLGSEYIINIPCLDKGSVSFLPEDKLLNVCIKQLAKGDTKRLYEYLDTKEKIYRSEVLKIEEAFRNTRLRKPLPLISKFYEKALERIEEFPSIRYKLPSIDILQESLEDILNFKEMHEKLFFYEKNDKTESLLEELTQINIKNLTGYVSGIAAIYVGMNQSPEKWCNGTIDKLNAIIESFNIDLVNILDSKFGIKITQNNFEGIIESAHFICAKENTVVTRVFESYTKMKIEDFQILVSNFTKLYYADKLNKELPDKPQKKSKRKI